jgi:hypothetical protein
LDAIFSLRLCRDRDGIYLGFPCFVDAVVHGDEEMKKAALIVLGFWLIAVAVLVLWVKL